MSCERTSTSVFSPDRDLIFPHEIPPQAADFIESIRNLQILTQTQKLNVIGTIWSETKTQSVATTGEIKKGEIWQELNQISRKLAQESGLLSFFEKVRSETRRVALSAALDSNIARQIDNNIIRDVGFYPSLEYQNFHQSRFDFAEDMALYNCVTNVCHGLEIPSRLVDHIKTRTEVWLAGAGVNCDKNGVIYTFGSLK